MSMTGCGSDRWLARQWCQLQDSKWDAACVQHRGGSERFISYILVQQWAFGFTVTLSDGSKNPVLCVCFLNLCRLTPGWVRNASSHLVWICTPCGRARCVSPLWCECVHSAASQGCEAIVVLVSATSQPLKILLWNQWGGRELIHWGPGTWVSLVFLLTLSERKRVQNCASFYRLFPRLIRFSSASRARRRKRGRRPKRKQTPPLCQRRVEPTLRSKSLVPSI